MDLKEWAYMDIKSKILNNDYKVGEQLFIEKICKELDISRTPVREALLRLQAEDYVYAASRVGFFVKGMTKDDFDDLFELREMIECKAAKNAAQDLTPQDEERLGKMQEISRNALNEKDLKTFNEMEQEIHNLISNYLKNKRVRKLLEDMKDQIHRERMLALMNPENVEMSLKEHDEIINALIKRDAKKAEKAMQNHLNKVKGRLTQSTWMNT